MRVSPPRVRGSGRRSPEDEDLRWLAKLEEREAQQASGASGGSMSSPQLTTLTTAALSMIQQQVDLLGLVTVFDSIAGARADHLTSGQLAKALRRMGLFVDEEMDARLLSRLIIRSINQRHGSVARRTLSFDIFCGLFDKQRAQQESRTKHSPETTLAARVAVDGGAPPSTVFFSPELHDSPGSPQAAAADVRQHQRYLNYLIRCQRQGIVPAPEVTAMAHEMMASTRDALMLAAASVRSVEQQLSIGDEDVLDA